MQNIARSFSYIKIYINDELIIIDKHWRCVLSDLVNKYFDNSIDNLYFIE